MENGHKAIQEHNQTDEVLQKTQNSLIERNTKITIWLGALAILAQLIDTLVNIFT